MTLLTEVQPSGGGNVQVLPLHSDLSTDSAVSNSKSQTNNPEKHVSPVHDLIAGGVAGSASVIVGHPFDTIKVRMQISSGGSSGATAAYGGGNVRSLFRGIGAPLSTAAVVNAIIFASYGATSRLWDSYYHIPHNDEEDFHGVIAGSEGAIFLEHAQPTTLYDTSMK